MRVPRLLAVSDPAVRRESALDFFDWVELLVEAGVDALQIREKNEPTDALYERVSKTVERFGDLAVWVNGRLDVALAAGADGVHLPSNGLPARAVRRRFGDRRFQDRLGIGVACHSIPEIEAAREDGADYVTFSPIFPTPSKPDHPGRGLDALERAAAVGVPVIALGGVGPKQVASARRAGAAGVAGIRTFHRDETLRDTVAAWGS